MGYCNLVSVKPQVRIRFTYSGTRFLFSSGPVRRHSPERVRSFFLQFWHGGEPSWTHLILSLLDRFGSVSLTNYGELHDPPKHEQNPDLPAVGTSDCCPNHGCCPCEMRFLIVAE